MKTIAFEKLSGAGNDFIVFDNRSSKIKSLSGLARTWCDRKSSIGGDGLITLEASKKSEIGMRIFNPDGSQAEMCGNGVRCLAKFAHDRKIIGPKSSIETRAGVIYAEVRGDVVKAKMINPQDLQMNLTLRLRGKKESLGFVNTGVPHAVKIVSDIEQVDVASVGKAIRDHQAFAPRGTNANFVSFGKAGILSVRTYERGVEAETLACGTGSTACSVVAAALKNLPSPVTVKTRSGETLKVYFSRTGNQFYDVYLEGKIRNIFEGRIQC